VIVQALTPRDTIHRDGTAQLYRFRRPQGVAPQAGRPILLVPSLINRWYVMDLREGKSLVQALTQAGLDVFCLDWGVAQDEDRYLTWDDVIARLQRAMRVVRRTTGADKIGMLGYCMGATLVAIAAALEPERTAAVINLLGPIDFSKAGVLGEMTDPRWFDPEPIAEAGNIAPMQMQSAFVMLRPTGTLAKWITFMERAHDPEFRDQFAAVEHWANDNVPFPAAAYVTYIREMYQGNTLVQGSHRVGGKLVDLRRIECPVLTIVAERDTICPPPSALALNECCGSSDRQVLQVPGGHVGAVVGSKASTALYPSISQWLRSKLCDSTN
jgi:polyhydroxyalkanoate synthase